MIRKVESFSIWCDGCHLKLGATHTFDMVPIVMGMNGWKYVNGKVYCPFCQAKMTTKKKERER